MIGARVNIGPYGWFLILDEILGKDETKEMWEATAKAPRTKFRFHYCEDGPHVSVWIEGRDLKFGGWSQCHPDDRFEKAKGRVVAITRALAKNNVPRETRREIWAEYWAQGHRRPR